MKKIYTKNSLIKKIIFAVFILCLSFLNNTVYASDVTIRSFSPASGKPGDLVTIIGFNYAKLKKVTFGNIEATVTGKTLSPTPNGFDILEVKVPTGAVTSKITIESSVNGTATSDTDFIIDTTPTPVGLKWYFIDNAMSYRGPFDDVTECRTQLTAEKVATGNNALADCVQKTLGQVAQGASNTDLVLLDPMKVDGGSGVYKLLAPIGSLESIDTTGKTCPGNPDIANGIGCYLNIIFKIAIGLCAALAVIMLVINGIKYMTSESFTEKSELKKDMLGPIMGLFIALGAFAILNTINPALTGKEGISVDQVEYEIVVRDRANDTEFMSNIDSFDVSNITVNPSDYNDPAFLGYLSHQQGVGGASAILWAAKKGYSEVPSPNPFVKKANINRNMRSNFNASSAQRTIGTSTLTPANFLKYWATKVAASKKKTSPQIPAVIDNDLIAVATETGVDIATLRAVCRIESHKGCTDATSDPSSITKVNSAGYSGLFQMGKAEFEKYKKSGGVILSAYHNAYAAARYFKSNLSGINKNWPKINN